MRDLSYPAPASLAEKPAVAEPMSASPRTTASMMLTDTEAAPAAQAGAEENAPPRPSARPRLLVVDDEEGPRISLKVIFQDQFEVVLAEDGPAAIARAQQERFDVAVLDIRMGGMSGIEVLERLRYIDPALEAVMMTAYETTDTIRQALRLQACDYLNKPFDLEAMRSAVARALERRSLASAVQTNGQQLAQLQKDLESVRHESELNRTRGEIYGSIIHDINGPLTVISSLLQFINQDIGDQDHLAGEDLEVVKDRLKRITRQATTCIEISRRYLGLLRGARSEASHIWINQVLHDVSDLARAHPSMRNHQFLVRPLPEDVASPVHGTDLLQMLLNLAINAFQCSPQPHRVEVAGQLLHQPVDMGTLPDGEAQRFINRDGFHNHGPLLAVSVEDNGPGIPAEVMPRLFEPYFTTKARHQGTGLGLCIVQRLLRESRGGLHVRSTPGQGTTFTVYVPAIAGQPAGPVQP
ncbi:MAG: hypothetical protein RJA22_2401 [Verrucomicrobiota bacterium]